MVKCGPRLCAITLLITCTIGSIAALASGLALMTTDIRDASKDFSTLASPCPITAVYHKASTYTNPSSKSQTCFSALHTDRGY